jgi:hypothetical protein
LGFYLERTGVSLPYCPEKAYRGIDRLPYIPGLEEEPGLFLKNGVKTASTRIWERYTDAVDDMKLHSNLSLALTLQREFLSIGLKLEVVYSEIILIPNDLQRYRHGGLWSENFNAMLPLLNWMHDAIGERPDAFRLLGYDLSQLMASFHSAIFQPGLHNNTSKLDEQLNGEGLFDDLDTASRFLCSANEMDYGTLPFLVMGVWELSR